MKSLNAILTGRDTQELLKFIVRLYERGQGKCKLWAYILKAENGIFDTYNNIT